MTWREKHNHTFLWICGLCHSYMWGKQRRCVCSSRCFSVGLHFQHRSHFIQNLFLFFLSRCPSLFFIFTNLMPSHAFCFLFCHFFPPHLCFSFQSYSRRSTPVTRQPSPGRCHASRWTMTRIRSCKPIRKGESTSVLCPATSPLPT